MTRSLKSILLFIFLSLQGLMASAQDWTDPVVYNNYIINEQAKLISQGLEYMSFSIHSEDPGEIDKRRLELLSEIRRSINKIRRMPDFQGTARLKRETIDVFQNYLKLYEVDLIESLGLKKQYNDAYEALEAYMKAETDLEQKMKRSIEQLSNAQEAFAKRYDLKISGTGGGTQLNSRVKQISDLSSYTRAVFMEYFKVSWVFNDMVKILPEKNGRQLDKSRLDVIEASETALKNLRKMERFEDEREYMDQTIDIIRYFHGLSRKEFARVAQIYRKDSMSQKDADYVNKVFADYNANIEILVYNWNLANQYLWKDHIK